MKIKIAVLLFCSVSLVACTHTPTKADTMLSASAQAKDLGNKWSQGDKLISNGNEKQKNGITLVSKGDKLIKEGKQETFSGTQLQQESENNFNNRFPAVPLERDDENS